MPQRSRLKNAKISSVHLVDKGDNPEAHCVMFKRAPDDAITESEIDELIKAEQESESAPSPDESAGLLAQWVESGRRLFGGGGLTQNSISNLPAGEGDGNAGYTPLDWSTATLSDTATLKIKPTPIVIDTADSLDVLEKHVAAIGKAGRKISGERLRRLKEVRQTLQSMIDEVGQQVQNASDAGQATQKGAAMPFDPNNLEGLDEEVRKYIEDLRSKVEKKDDEPEEDPIFKGMNSQQVAFFKAQSEIINTMKREREEREYIEKSRKFDGLPVNPAELGPVLRRVAKGQSKAEDETYIVELLASMNAMQKQGALFGEAGSIVRGNTGSAESELMSKATEIASREGIGTEAALAKVRRDPANQELVKRYYEEVHS